MLLPQSKNSKHNLLLKIIFFSLEFIFFLKTFSFNQANNYLFPKLLFYFQFLSFFPEFIYFNFSIELESFSLNPSDEYLFNCIISLKLFLAVLASSCCSNFNIVVFFYFFVWKMSFIIRTEKLGRYSINDSIFNQKIELYYILSNTFNFFTLIFFFYSSLRLLFLPLIIEVFITFPCLLLKKEPEFVPLQFPINFFDIIKSRYKKNNVSLISVFLFFFFSLLVTNNSNITKIISILILFIFLILDINYLRILKISFIAYYKSTIFKIFIYLLWCYLYSKRFFFDFAQFDKSSLITFLSSILVFNLGAFFILLQFNYQKYYSEYLIRKLMNPIIIFISILLPAFFIFCINFFKKDFFIVNTYFPYAAFIISIFSAVLLLFYFSVISESWFLLNLLLNSSNYYDFANHRESIFQLSESKIEAIQSIISADIKNGNLNVLRTDFLALADWTKLNIKNIRYQSKLYIHERDNRFKNFYHSIGKLVLAKKDVVLEDVFFDAFIRRCLFDVTYENFSEYKILYDVLFDFIKEEIETDEIEAKNNLRDLLIRFPYILVGIKSVELKIDFEEHIVKKIEEIYDYAIKNNKSLFISRFTCLSDVFSNFQAKNENLIIEFNGFHVDIFKSLHRILRKLIEGATLDNKYLIVVSEELKEFDELLLKMDYRNINVSHVWDYQLFLCEQLVKKAMQINYLESTFVFSPICDICYESTGNLFHNSLIVFTKLIDDFFDYLSNHNNNNYILKIWSHIDNLLNYYEDNPIELVQITSFTSILIKKYPILNNYPELYKQTRENFYKYKIEDFNYDELDIRKQN